MTRSSFIYVSLLVSIDTITALLIGFARALAKAVAESAAAPTTP